MKRKKEKKLYGSFMYAGGVFITCMIFSLLSFLLESKHLQITMIVVGVLTFSIAIIRTIYAYYKEGKK